MFSPTEFPCQIWHADTNGVVREYKAVGWTANYRQWLRCEGLNGGLYKGSVFATKVEAANNAIDQISLEKHRLENLLLANAANMQTALVQRALCDTLEAAHAQPN